MNRRDKLAAELDQAYLAGVRDGEQSPLDVIPPPRITIATWRPNTWVHWQRYAQAIGRQEGQNIRRREIKRMTDPEAQ